MSPLEKAIEQIENEKRGASQLFAGGLQQAILICQRILSEEHNGCFMCGDKESIVLCGKHSISFKSVQPKTESKWEMKVAGDDDATNLEDETVIYLDEGYEPFAVDQGVIYFKRPVCDK